MSLREVKNVIIDQTNRYGTTRKLLQTMNEAAQETLVRITAGRGAKTQASLRIRAVSPGPEVI